MQGNRNNVAIATSVLLDSIKRLFNSVIYSDGCLLTMYLIQENHYIQTILEKAAYVNKD